MKIMLDTNVLFSMILFPNDRFQKLLLHISEKHVLLLSSFVIKELEDVVRRKLPDRLSDIAFFLSDLRYETVYTPDIIDFSLFEIRDTDDYPVLYSAIISDVDIFITGDEDFFDVQIERPKIMTPRMYLDAYLSS